MSTESILCCRTQSEGPLLRGVIAGGVLIRTSGDWLSVDKIIWEFGGQNGCHSLFSYGSLFAH